MFKKSLIALSLISLLSACDSDDDSSTTPITPVPTNPALELVLPIEGSSMVDDFPLAMYVTYPEEEQVVDAITSIDINWPMFDIHQANKEYGFIDGDSNELFYHSVAQQSNEAMNAVDLERQEDLIWFVSGDNVLSQYNRSTDKTTQWTVNEGAEFTELTLDEEGNKNIWLYDQVAHQLVHFNAETEQSINYELTADIAVNGISITEEKFFLLAEADNNDMVMLYEAEGSTLTHNDSWYLEGFETTAFNDISLMPDGRIAVSTSDIENNIYLVMDKDDLIGAGPIEDSGELTLVAQYPLSEDIVQPSGIWSMFDDTWMIITDQAEMFTLDSDFNKTSRVEINFDSINCNQGCTEAIVGGVDEFFALTDTGLVGQFNKVNDVYELTKEHHIDVKNDDGHGYRYSGLGKDESSGEYFLVPDQGNEDDKDVLIILNRDFSLKEKHDITFPEETNGSIFAYDAQGVQYSDGHVYVLSETFTKVIQLNLVGEIIAVFDLDNEDVTDPSDLAIRDGQVYILGDHENEEPVPPVSVFTITYH
ncbi:hypothetical protein CXF85_11580 [Colwellia sp. 75C3]|uniref:hypothetical protein n=1 Tax=Colwellia sp. 75C3 TaxID=888425 RepID=UPI000C3209CE|nr:hypothetical protein [Colwellia sp. 75C3]PKG83167.1 hypothetical protein CXF85_11580 [Colwellia sp. 75C3]